MCRCEFKSCPTSCSPNPAPMQSRRGWILPLGVLVVVLVATALMGDARAEVFHSRESALELAFPAADSVITQSLMISREAAARITGEARVALPSRLANLHAGWRDGEIVGYAYIESHKVRSLPETLMVVVGPDGRAKAVHLLAFHEPKQYMPSARWLSQYAGRKLDEDLSLRGNIAGVAGSTLTAQAITAAVRRILATHEECVTAAQLAASETETLGPGTR